MSKVQASSDAGQPTTTAEPISAVVVSDVPLIRSPSFSRRAGSTGLKLSRPRPPRTSVRITDHL